jgi:peroxiredoxin
VIHDDSTTSAYAFAETYNAQWPLLADPNEVAWNAYHGAFVPVSYFIDRDGIVRAVSYGAPPGDYIDTDIAKIL